MCMCVCVCICTYVRGGGDCAYTRPEYDVDGKSAA